MHTRLSQSGRLSAPLFRKATHRCACGLFAESDTIFCLKRERPHADREATTSLCIVGTSAEIRDYRIIEPRIPILILLKAITTRYPAPALPLLPSLHR